MVQYRFDAEIDDPVKRAFEVRKRVVDSAMTFIKKFEKSLKSDEDVNPFLFDQYKSCCEILQKASINKEFADKHESKSLSLTGDVTATLVQMADDRDKQVRKMLLDAKIPQEKIEDAEIVS